MRPKPKTAQFVCQTLDEHYGAEFRFTKLWKLSLDDKTLYDPKLVAIQCPGCRTAWNVHFEKFLE